MSARQLILAPSLSTFSPFSIGGHLLSIVCCINATVCYSYLPLTSPAASSHLGTFRHRQRKHVCKVWAASASGSFHLLLFRLFLSLVNRITLLLRCSTTFELTHAHVPCHLFKMAPVEQRCVRHAALRRMQRYVATHSFRRCFSCCTRLDAFPVTLRITFDLARVRRVAVLLPTQRKCSRPLPSPPRFHAIPYLQNRVTLRSHSIAHRRVDKDDSSPLSLPISLPAHAKRSLHHIAHAFHRRRVLRWVIEPLVRLNHLRPRRIRHVRKMCNIEVRDAFVKHR